MMMFAGGRRNEGIQIIRTLPCAFDNRRKGSRVSHSFVHSTDDSSTALLLEAIENHECLIKSKLHSPSSNNATKQRTIALYQRASLNTSCLYIKIIADNNIAQILHCDRKYHLALSALEQASANLHFAEKLYANNHSTSFSSTITKKQRARISEEIFIPVLSNLGFIYFILDENDRALQCIVRALEGDKPRRSAITATLWFNFGIIQQKLFSKRTGITNGAEALYAFERALGILENDYVPGSATNRDIVTVQAELLLLRRKRGSTIRRNASLVDYDSTTALLRDLVHQREEYGYEDYTVAQTLCAIGSLFMNKDQHLIASHFLGEAIRIYKYLKSPATLSFTPMLHLGVCFQVLDRNEEAMVCFRSILQSQKQETKKKTAKKKKLEETEEDEAKRKIKEVRATALYQMGIIQSKQAQQGRALKSFEMCLELRRSSYGNVHPAVAAVLQNMGVILLDEKNITMALHCFTESLQVRKYIYGQSHPKVVTSLRHIGRAHQERGDYVRALKYYQDALSISRTLSTSSWAAMEFANDTMIEILLGLGQTQQSLCLLDAAFKSYMEAAGMLRRMKLSRRAGEQEKAYDGRIVNILKIMGGLALDMSDLDRAIRLFAEAAKISGKEEDSNLLINTVPPAAAAA